MSIPQISPRHDAGNVVLKEGLIYWNANGRTLLNVSVASITIIGEYTTVHALHKNEWFLVCVLKEGEMLQISMYADGMYEVLTQLSLAFESEFSPALEDARDFKSNVIWPLEYAGQELYELKVKESKSFFDRFRARLGFGDPVELVLRENLNTQLASKTPRREDS